MVKWEITVDSVDRNRHILSIKTEEDETIKVGQMIQNIDELLNTAETLHTVIHQVFGPAAEDGYIRTNPSDGVMQGILNV